MKIVNCSEEQLTLLKYLCPEKRVSPYLALVPASEYFFWSRRFTSLYDAVSSFIYPLKITTKVPVVQCVSKFIGLSPDGFLLPKVFKFGTLSDGSLKDFGLSYQLLPLLETIASSFSYPLLKQVRDLRVDYLGCLAWDVGQPPQSPYDRNLTQFMHCVPSNRVGDVWIKNDKVFYDNKEYPLFLPSYNYYENAKYQHLLATLQEQRLLALPLNFPLTNLPNLVGFTHPAWAEVKPLDFFLEEDPEKLDKYVLIRTDDGKIVTWNEVMTTPKLRLEIEMENYWLWQESCKTSEALEHINLYWEFGMDYPWLIDRRNNTIIPTLLVDD